MAKPTIGQINAFHPLASGLVFCVAPGGSTNNELVEGGAGSLLVSSDWDGVTSQGTAFESESNVNGGAYWAWSADMVSAFDSDITIAFYAEIDSLASNGRIFSIPPTNISTGIELGISRSVSGSAVNFWYYGTALRSVTSDSGFVTGGEGLTLYAVTRSGSNVVFSRNGVQLGASKVITNESITFTGSGVNATVFNRNSGAPGVGVDGRLHTMFVYNRALSLSDLASLAADPFVIFRVPDTPTGVSATAIDQNTIAVSWSPVSSVEGYAVEYSLDRNTWVSVSTVSTSINLTVLADARYYIRVRAFNYSFSSDYSPTQTVITPDFPPLQMKYLADWDNDGFFCRNARPGDPLNLAIDHGGRIGSYTQLRSGTGGSTSTIETETDYGPEYIRWTMGISTTARLDIGYDNPNTTGEIAVMEGQTYYAVLWIRSESASYDSIPLTLNVKYFSGTLTTLISSSSFTVPFASGWVQKYVQFTVPAGIGLVSFGFSRADASTTSAIYNIAGLMQLDGDIDPADIPQVVNYGPATVYDDFSAYVNGSSWNIGFKDLFVNNFLADENVLEVEVINSSQLFSKENTNSFLDFAADNPLIAVEASNDEGATFQRMYTGYIEYIRPDFGRTQEVPRAMISAVSSRRFLQGKTTRIDLQIAKTTKQVINALLAEAVLPDGSTLALASGSPDGQTYPYAADNWQDNLDLLRAVHDVVGADGMIFYFNRDNEPVTQYLSDYVDIAPPSPDYQIGTHTVIGSTNYEYGETFLKSVEYAVSPRRISSTSDKVLWELTDGIDLAAGEVVEIIARYTNEKEDRTIGATNVTYDNFLGDPGTGNVVVTLTPKATSCLITLDASARVNPTTITSLRLRGQKITAFDKVYARYESPTLQIGGIEQNFDFKSLASLTRANEITQALIRLYSRPRGRVRWFDLPFTNRWNDVFINATIGTVISIDDTQNSGHNAIYVITGESHGFDGKKRRSRYFVELFIFDVGF